LEGLRAAGVSVVQFDMGWDRYEPRPGVVDRQYVAELLERFNACREAGMQLVLSPGLQAPPPWVSSLPSALLLDRNGTAPTEDGGLDLVFSSAVREAASRYVRRIATDIGFDGVLAVRLGTSGSGELAYPGPDEGTSPDGRDYWAFSEAAQTGIGLAAGMEPTPLPGWVPGDRTWNGQPVSTEQVTSWFSWYSRALIMAIGGQADLWRAVGFSGDFHVPVAGSGAFPSDLQAALQGALDGRNSPMGALERGLYYPDQFALLAELDRRLRTRIEDHGIAVDFTGLDDVTAVLARRAVPPQDACQPGDPETAAAGVGVEEWSGQRFTLATARHHGLNTVGENPGPPNEPTTGGSPDSDMLHQQLTRGIAYARQCGLSLFLFAFERNLFDGSSGVDLDDYAREIHSS
jgi:hypothetical protein